MIGPRNQENDGCRVVFGGQTKWEEDSPHQLVMLYEMFRHAADKGQTEVE